LKYPATSQKRSTTKATVGRLCFFRLSFCKVRTRRAGDALVRTFAARLIASWRFLVVVSILALGGLVFAPGVDGPFVFDDQPNISRNDYLKIHALEWDALRQAAHSSHAGPLGRPIPMVSFAVNHYFAGGFEDTVPFKLTNLIIHFANGVLVFWFLHLLLRRLTVAYPGQLPWLGSKKGQIAWLAGAVALLWLVHPIQLTTVLYVVQRMVSLAALFTLLALICYLVGRERLVAPRRGSAWIPGVGFVVFAVLGALSKENALLLPLFVILVEYWLFSGEPPIARWHTLSRTARRAVVGASLLAVFAMAAWALHYAAQGYSVREFDMGERVLTQTRVLWFYISLIIAPRLNDLGLNHDDIPISTSLVSPWTTLPSLLGVVGLIAAAFHLRNRHPLLGLGILWFFVGHALESSIFPLEMAHEHRNYLPSLGILLSSVHIAGHAAQRVRRKGALLAFVAMPTVIFAIISTIRSDQWSSLHVLARYEALHHPRSARAQTYLAISLARAGDYQGAMEASRRAAGLEPRDPVYLINLHLISSYSGLELSATERLETERRLRTSGLTVSSSLAIEMINDCLTDRCAAISKEYSRWLEILLDNPDVHTDRSYLYYLLGRSLAAQGRTEDALMAFDKASKLDVQYLHPRLEAAQLLIRARQIDRAERVLSELHEISAHSRYPRDTEIRALAAQLSHLKGEAPSRQTSVGAGNSQIPATSTLVRP
jgi:Flp pilus assembly protein TadD